MLWNLKFFEWTHWQTSSKNCIKINIVKYRAEALDVKRHSSREHPPVGPIWDSKKQKGQAKNSVDTMTVAFTEMANSMASAFS